MNNTTIEVAKGLLAKGEQNRAMAVFADAVKADPSAFREMADCYAQGVGVGVDNHRARKYRDLARRMEKKQRERRVREARLHRQMLDGISLADYTHFAGARQRAFKIADCKERMEVQKDWLIRASKAHRRQMRQERTAARVISRPLQSRSVAPLIENAASRVWSSFRRNDAVAGNAFERLVACF